MFGHKIIEINIVMSGGAIKNINNLACDLEINKPGLPAKNQAKVRIWGLPYEDMSLLTMLAFEPHSLTKNIITIRAGEKKGPLGVVFQGEISSAFADFNTAPDVTMHLLAQSGIFPQQVAEGPLSIKGEAQAAHLIEKLAHTLGYSFKNEGVSASVRNGVFNGSPLKKIQDIANQVGAELILDDDTLVLIPHGAHRQGLPVPLDSTSGLVGFPTFNQDGISLKTIYNPNLVYGGLVAVKSVVPRASGLWKITRLNHKLTALKAKNGAWHSHLEACYV
ncbi:MAG: baseplate hub protein [Candidatus Adiutrix sp.]